MKRVARPLAQFLVNNILGKQRTLRLISLLTRLSFSAYDVLWISYQNMGIANWQNQYVSGEHFVINHVLKKHIVTESPVFFDVGANTGEYSQELKKAFTSSKIYAFEPNLAAFIILKAHLSSVGISCVNQGLGAEPGKVTLYIPTGRESSQHATVYKDGLLCLRKSHGIAEQSVTTTDLELTTIDEFCDANKINYIDFLKIDTEGHDLEVLKGAENMIKMNKIRVLQFEFNELNIISRVFLKDFYDLLTNYDIYRMGSDQLIPLLEYSSVNEIFQFQNFLAINRTCRGE